MELADDRSIKGILASMERSRRRRDASRRTLAPVRGEPTVPVRREPKISVSNSESRTSPVRLNSRCDSGKCATCAVCISNAKWEKVFNEKFADPNYYKTARPLKIGSSLSRLP